jgi:hypothetical protein
VEYSGILAPHPVVYSSDLLHTPSKMEWFDGFLHTPIKLVCPGGLLHTPQKVEWSSGLLHSPKKVEGNGGLLHTPQKGGYMFRWLTPLSTASTADGLFRGLDILVVYSTQKQDPQQVENSGGLFLAPLLMEYVFLWFTPHLGQCFGCYSKAGKISFGLLQSWPNIWQSTTQLGGYFRS